jgi:hypothetical protein
LLAKVVKAGESARCSRLARLKQYSLHRDRSFSILWQLTHRHARTLPILIFAARSKN